jgi:transcription elongation factor Elf1
MDAHDVIECPWCNEAQQAHECMLGALGPMFNFRCRHCGGDFARTAPTEDKTDETLDESNSGTAVPE